MSRARPLLLAASLAVVGAPSLEAQQVETPPPAAPTGPPEGRPGLWRLGPLYLTPTVHVGNIGIDTNVLFQAEDRQRDFSVSGGPGLDLAVPVTRSFRILGTSQLDYLYFANNADQRRLTGSASGGLRFDTGAFLAGAEYSYIRSFDRPSPQVDDRIDQTQERARVELGVWGGARRLGISGAASATRYDIEAGQFYLGSDLRATLARDEYLAQVAIRYGLTPKTSLVLSLDQVWDRFLEAPIRDADSNRALAGFEVVSDTRLSGRALGGVRSFRPKRSDETRLLAVADVSLTYSVSPKTRFEVRFRRDFDYSAFVASGPTPTVTTETLGFGLRKTLVANLDLRLAGSLNRLLSDGDLLLVLPDQGPVLTARKDEYWQGGADLGYTFGARFRVGIAAAYADRNSSVSYFGVQGLVMGATVTYSGTPTVVLHP